MTVPRRVVVIDDHDVVRMALGALVDAHPGLVLVAEAADGPAGIDAVVTHAPDIAMVDVRMPGMSGIETTRRILEHRPATRVVVLSGYDDSAIRHDASQAGARAFVCKGSPADVVYAALLG